MKEVYFDTNVYTRLDKLLASKNFEVCDRLRRAVVSDRLRIYSSFTVYEETNTALIDYPNERKRRFRLIRKLAKRKKMIRIHFEILANDVRSYAMNEPFKSPFMAPFPGLRQLHAGENIQGLLDVATSTRQNIRDFRDRMRTAYSTHIVPLARRVIEDNEVPTFEENYRDNAAEFGRMIARKAGYQQQCEDKGLDGLLRVPSVDAIVRAELSIIYANTYLGRLQNQGDSRDVQHVQLAATVGNLITEDAGLVKVVKRMNCPHVKVMGLHELIQTLS
jgi:hypothetical protein